MEQAAAEMIELRRQGGASEPYLADLRCRTKSFIEAFKVHPASVTTADCQRWLDGLAGASSTKNATRRVIHRLFAHCESRGYIPRNSNPIAETQTGHTAQAGVNAPRALMMLRRQRHRPPVLSGNTTRFVTRLLPTE